MDSYEFRTYVRVSYILSFLKKHKKLRESVRQKMVNTRYKTARDTTRFVLEGKRRGPREKQYIPLEQALAILVKYVEQIYWY